MVPVINSEQIPKVSIGLAVYNGENFLQQALDSLLAQTFTDFELIISNNASTDSTEAICLEYAAKDPRVHYFCNEHNIGAAGNFNRVFGLARGEYFKWAAHDDLYAPDYLERCVQVLDRDPATVLCHSKVKLIDAQGQEFQGDAGYVQDCNVEMQVDAEKPHERARDLILKRHSCYLSFALTRRAVLKQTPLIGPYAHSDGVMLVGLALRGRFHILPDYLFFYRDHPEQSVKIARSNVGLYASWFDTALAGKITFPRWRVLWEYSKIIWHAPIDGQEKLRCYGYWLQWAFAKKHLLLRDCTIGVRKALKRIFVSVHQRLTSRQKGAEVHFTRAQE